MLLAPYTADAAAPRSFKELVDFFVFLMDNVVVILVLCAIVLYFWGITQNINKFSESGEGPEKVRAYFFWGIIILFVMVSVWGILRILENSLFGSGASANSVVNGSSGGAPCSGFSDCGGI